MRYDPSLPIAVFLGPTLDHTTARAILAANYYPPARMGDVYRLMASGVTTILLIDGFFHGTTPIWQREIRAALEAGILVVGAASMGALRAMELAPFGMVGCGTVWSWFRDQTIDGDDEVALLHGDESVHYRPMSEPLVNIRHNVRRAVERGWLDVNQADELLARSKRRSFGARSYRGLLEDARVIGIAPEQCRQCERFFEEEAVDLKRQDALEALRTVATLGTLGDRTNGAQWAAPREGSRPQVRRAPPTDIDDGFSSIACLKRGVRGPHGDLVAAESILSRLAGQEARIQELRRIVSERFFVRCWASERCLDAPSDWRATFRQRWIRAHGAADLAVWLADVGLTPDEFDNEMRQRATVDWLLDGDPQTHGLDFEPHRRCIELLSTRDRNVSRAQAPSADGQSEADDRATVRRRLAEACYVATWARARGIRCPKPIVEAFVESCEARWGVLADSRALASAQLDRDQYVSVLSERACYHWAADQGPNYFGFSTFSYPQALLTELQVTGTISDLVDRDVAS